MGNLMPMYKIIERTTINQYEVEAFLLLNMNSTNV